MTQNTPNQINDPLKKDTPDEAALHLAFKYLSYRSRTIFEVKTYLEKKSLDTPSIEAIIAYLKERKYLDDRQYCRQYLEYRAAYKPRSLFAFRYDLRKKGVAGPVIEKELSRYNDESLAMKAVKQKVKQWQNFDETKFKNKIINYLRYRGFNFEICMVIFEKIKSDRGIP